MQDHAPRHLRRLTALAWRSSLRRAEGEAAAKLLLGELTPKPPLLPPLVRVAAWSTVGTALLISAQQALELLATSSQHNMWGGLTSALSSFGLPLLTLMFIAWRFSRLTKPLADKKLLQRTVRAPDLHSRLQADAQAQLLTRLSAIPGFQLGCDVEPVWHQEQRCWAACLERAPDQPPVAWAALEGDDHGGALEIALLGVEVGRASVLQSFLQRPHVAALLQQLALDADAARWQEQPTDGEPGTATVWLRLRLRDQREARADALDRRAGASDVRVDLQEDPAAALAELATLLLEVGLGVERAASSAAPAQLHVQRALPAAAPAQRADAARWTLAYAEQQTRAAEPPPYAAAPHSDVGGWRGWLTFLVMLSWMGGWGVSLGTLELNAASIAYGGIAVLLFIVESALNRRHSRALPRAVGVGLPQRREAALRWDGERHLRLGDVTLDLDAPFQLQLSREPAPDGAASTCLGVTLLQSSGEGPPRRLVMKVPGLAVEGAEALPTIALDAPICPAELWTDTLQPLLKNPLEAHGAAPVWSVAADAPRAAQPAPQTSARADRDASLAPAHPAPASPHRRG